MVKSVVICILVASWILLPIVLVVLSIREWRRTNEFKTWQRALIIIVAVSILVDLISFLFAIAIGSIGGFGSHYMTTRNADWFVLGSLLILAFSALAKVSRGKLALGSLLVLALWVGSELVA
jgi:hypothetical protein